MESLPWKKQLEKIVTSCKYYRVVTDMTEPKAKNVLQRAFWGLVLILGIDLKRSRTGGYLIKSEGNYIELDPVDFELCIYEIAHIIGLQNYNVNRGWVNYVLKKTYKRKQILN